MGDETVRHPPENNEIEISIFGPGFGEALAVHIGGGEWILVDSCIEPGNSVPAQIRYLESMGVDVSTQVRLIVATHWLKDHVTGLGAVVSRCMNAEVAVSPILDSEQFNSLMGLYEHTNGDIDGPEEFNQIIRILHNRRRPREKQLPIKWVSENRLLLRKSITSLGKQIEVSIYSMSPSDATRQKGLLSLGSLFPNENDSPAGIPAPEPNHASIVLWVEIGNCCMLLGADLENTSDPGTGWSALIENTEIIRKKATIFKIPHHGSSNGHSDAVWSDLLIRSPYSLITPYNRGKYKLPRQEDLQRITTATENAYITARPSYLPPKFSKLIVRSIVRKTANSISKVRRGWGIVTIRWEAGTQIDRGKVALEGDAYALS